MADYLTGKKKLFNDPVYGFIQIPDKLHFDIIEHSYFQRLRRIKQLGLTHLVYPGALHTRFQHSIGAMHLMQLAIAVLRSKGHVISDEELQAASLAILLHDIGHGPYSHTLEKTIVTQMTHEQLSSKIMRKLNDEFNHQLAMSIEIFEGTYHRKFLCQLVSSQLDMDRMDYLKRDSFFSGVAEGTINADRLLAMLDMAEDQLVIEAKGIYSVEKFLGARRLMYWQVYLHKTVLSAEYMLMNCLRRAKQLSIEGHSLPATPALSWFLMNEPNDSAFDLDEKPLDMFAQLDDFDVFTALKLWQHYPDKVLSVLSSGIVNRQLFRVELSNEPFEEESCKAKKCLISKHFSITDAEAEYLFIEESTSNHAYHPLQSRINILYKDGQLKDISLASDQLNISVLSHPVTKYFICYPKTIINT
ncbi:MAG: putative metal-dependent phosphohydrolase [Bacteroidetes bacterium]|nr:MAG: putative metal-dependent phosphohydrolase [Bacteroidota bacterium]